MCSGETDGLDRRWIGMSRMSTAIRCAVAAFRSRDGVFNAHNVTFDTDVERGGGRGYVDLRNETVNPVMSGEAKSFNILRMNAPITVTRHLANPKVGVQASVAFINTMRDPLDRAVLVQESQHCSNGTGKLFEKLLLRINLNV